MLQELLDSAAYAPTGSNAQNLLVSVVDDIAAMDALREAVYLRLDELAETGAMPDCQRRAFFLSAGKLWKAGDGTGIFRSAPHCVIVANAKNATCVEQDPLIYLSYFELMAQARGIGTLWCGLLYWCLRDVLPDFLPRLGIPDTHQLGYAMLFGYPPSIIGVRLKPVPRSSGTSAGTDSTVDPDGGPLAIRGTAPFSTESGSAGCGRPGDVGKSSAYAP